MKGSGYVDVMGPKVPEKNLLQSVWHNRGAPAKKKAGKENGVREKKEP